LGFDIGPNGELLIAGTVSSSSTTACPYFTNSQSGIIGWMEYID